MTAEIAVLNREAVALAADSVATVRSIRSGGGGKAYPSGNKIFELSRNRPVAVMLHGGAEFTDIPWDTLIKTFPEDHTDAYQRELAAYRDGLLSHVAHVAESGERAWVEGIMRTTFTQLQARVWKAARTQLSGAADRGLRSRDVTSVADQLIEESAGTAIAAEPLFKARTDTPKAFDRAYGELAETLAVETFGAISTRARFRRRLHELARELLLRRNRLGSASGLVIAGFGDTDLFPSLIQIEVEGIVLGQARAWELRSHSVRTLGAGIIPFAETGMVRTFLEGQHPDVQVEVRAALTGLAEANLRTVGRRRLKEPLSARLRARAATHAEEVVATAVQALDEFRSQRFSGRILATVELLPKEELAALAESLVNLTALSQRVTDAPESVGGPVDVALLSKGDGLIWIKRKRYFDPLENPAYFERRYGKG